MLSSTPQDVRHVISTFMTLEQKNRMARTSRTERETMRQVLLQEARLRVPQLPTITRRLEALERKEIRDLFSLEQVMQMLNLDHYHNNARLLRFMRTVVSSMSSPNDEALLLTLEDVIEKRIRRLDYQRNFKQILTQGYVDYLFSLPSDPYLHLLGFLPSIKSPEVRSHLAEAFLREDLKEYQKKRVLTTYLNPMAKKRLGLSK